LENAVAKSKPSPPAAPPTTTPGSLETSISQLSDRLHAVEEQLSLVTADVETLKAKNGIDASDYSSLQPMWLLTRDDVSKPIGKKYNLVLHIMVLSRHRL
jgi:hypothetical protein